LRGLPPRLSAALAAIACRRQRHSEQRTLQTTTAAGIQAFEIFGLSPSAQLRLIKVGSPDWLIHLVQRRSMSLYRISLLDQQDLPQAEQIIDFEHDDDAIDHAGSIDHPYAIDVWQADRHVVLFPPWPAPRPQPIQRSRSAH
jgi:hypothetical protein